MRILLAIPILLLGACNVAKDDANNTTTVSINEGAVENGAENLGNAVENVAKDVGNEASNLGDKIKNTDVNVTVNTDAKTENKSR